VIIHLKLPFGIDFHLDTTKVVCCCDLESEEEEAVEVANYSCLRCGEDLYTGDPLDPGTAQLLMSSHSCNITE
jgi:hypothetical protein